MANARIGVLALQGDFERHRAALESLGLEVREVRRADDLDGIAALFMPGGESTTMLRAMASNDLRAPLEAFVRSQPVLGTCAGVILLATQVDGPLPAPPLGVIDVAVERNAYGRQVDSFTEVFDAPVVGAAFPGVFIRAPRIRRVGAGVEVIARRPGHDGSGEPIGVRSGRAVGLCFHPELTADRRFHLWFLREVAGIPVGEPAKAPGRSRHGATR